MSKLTETDAFLQIKSHIDQVPHVVKFLLVALSVLSFRAYLDYFGLTLYLVAFGLGAVWMLTTSVLLLFLYLYLTQEAKEYTAAGPEVTIGKALFGVVISKNMTAAEIAARDKTAEVRIKGNVILQLEGSATDATKIPCELQGSTLFVRHLNGNPNVQALVIEGTYMRQLDDKTIEIIHPTRSLWQKEDYIYLKFNSSVKRQYWQNALSLICKKYSDIYHNPEHYEANDEMMSTFNALIKEYENSILKDPAFGLQGSTIINALLHRIWINITNSKDIRKAILQKLIEKIDVKLTFAAEAGKAERIREIAITDLDLGTRVPFFKDLRVEPAPDKDKDLPNRDFILRTHLAYVDGNALIAIRIDVKHSIPLLPMIFNIVVRIKRLEFDLRITGVAHPMKRFDIRIIESPLVDLDFMEGGGDLSKLKKVPGWESWAKDKVKKLINDAIEEKICEVLLSPERQYVNMPGVDSEEESSSEDHQEGEGGEYSLRCSVRNPTAKAKAESKSKKKDKDKSEKCSLGMRKSPSIFKVHEDTESSASMTMSMRSSLHGDEDSEKSFNINDSSSDTDGLFTARKSKSGKSGSQEIPMASARSRAILPHSLAQDPENRHGSSGGISRGSGRGQR